MDEWMDRWMSVQKWGKKCLWLNSAESISLIAHCIPWLKIFEMFTGCIIYMFDILKQTPISCSVTIPVKLLKRNQAKSQPPVCCAVSNLKANSSLTHSRFHAGGSKPLTVPLCQSNYVISEGSLVFNDMVASILRSRSSQSNMHSQ